MNKDNYNLGDGIKNVFATINNKLMGAGFRLESKDNTIININDYEHTLLVWALYEYAKQRGIKLEEESD